LDGVGQDLLVQAGTFNLNGQTMTVHRDVTVAGGSINGTNSFLTFAGTTTQTYRGLGETYGVIRSSNVSSGGLVFSSSFTASKLYVNTSELASSATIYFAGNSTVTATALSAQGTAAFPLVFRSTSNGTAWYLNNTSTYTVKYLAVKDSNASSGLRILDYPGGVDLGNNTNWVFGSNPPTSFDFSGVASTSLDMTWVAASPTPNSYSIQVSTNSNFSTPATTPYDHRARHHSSIVAIAASRLKMPRSPFLPSSISTK
jgi:hypothetical protein